MLGIKYPEFLVLVSDVSGGKGKEKIKMESESKGKHLTQMPLLKPYPTQHDSVLACQYHLWSCCLISTQ